MRNELDKLCEARLKNMGLTSKFVRVEIDGRGYHKEQWYFKGLPTDYTRQEGVAEWAKRNGYDVA